MKESVKLFLKEGGMIMLGIALYPDKTTIEEDKNYLSLAKKYGYQRVFMSLLQIDIENPKKSIQRLKESIQYANELQMEVTLDIHPMVFQYLKIKEDDLSYFAKMGVHTLRLDSGYDGRIEAMMTHNPYHIHIEVNMSKETNYLDLISSYHPQKQYLKGSHNFYPQRYTGLSLQSFMRCSQKFQNAHLSSAVFLTSQQAKVSPWPISEGLCTLEMHRDLPIEVQARHMKMLDMIDDWFIGNAYASEEELKTVSEIYHSQIDTLYIEINDDITDLEKEMLLKYIHEYRGDASEYVIRSSKNRQRYYQCSLPAHNIPKEIQRGDLLILNENYGQYKSEVQIALTDRQADARINVVGRVRHEDMILLECLKPFQCFQLLEKE